MWVMPFFFFSFEETETDEKQIVYKGYATVQGWTQVDAVESRWGNGAESVPQGVFEDEAGLGGLGTV